MALVAASVAALVAPASASAGPFSAFPALVNGSISGTSYEDRDADGTRDAGEPGAQGFSVYLDLDEDGIRDSGEPQATSGTDGSWTIDGLLAGSYRVAQAARAGWTCSAPTGCERTVALGVGEAASGKDFGAWRPARIVGTAYEDTNRDGDRDSGEPGRSRRTLFLDADGDGALDAGEPTAQSGVDGSYGFDNLRPGQWVVRESLPAGWKCSAPPACAHTVVLASGEEASSRDFGSWRDPDPVAPPVDPLPVPTIGAATLTVGTRSAGASAAVVGHEVDPASGEDVYMLPRSEKCQPLTVELPVDAGSHSVLGVDLVATPANGDEASTVELEQGGDGAWTGTFECAEEGALDALVTTPAGQSRLHVGELLLIDPSGTVYDEHLYRRLVERGASPSVARCESALSDATVTLQRRESGRFRAVENGDGGIAPRSNPQQSDSDGSYRWDVVRGRYRVRVEKDGYYETLSREVSVPPAVVDLHVALKRRPGTDEPERRDCGGATKAKPRPRTGCMLRPVNARVRGNSVRRVVFYLDGRHFKTVSRPDRSGRFGVTVQRRGLDPGAHRLRAKVIFKRSAGRRPAWLTLPIKPCAASTPSRKLKAGPRGGCVARPFRAWVRGARIRSVAFRLGNRRLGVASVADWRGRYRVDVDPTKLGRGKHVITARVRFDGSRSPRTLKLRFRRCS